MSQTPARKDPYQVVTDLILQQLEQGVVPWHRPWRHQTARPRNFHTGKAYQGINILLLGLQHFASPYWMTFVQVKERGGFVRKGEHSSFILKYGQVEKVQNEREEEETHTSRFLKSYCVFNAVQIEGIAFPAPDIGPQLSAAERIVCAEEILAKMPQRPKINEGRFDQARYRPAFDTVDMPAFAVFASPEEYYQTLFHELIHSTGHKSRLNRKGVTESDGFGKKEYSQEELIAEMGAAFLCMEAEIDHDEHKQSAAYLSSWLDALRDPDHRRWLVQAANQAGHAADFILGKIAEESSPVSQRTAEQSALPASA